MNRRQSVAATVSAAVLTLLLTGTAHAAPDTGSVAPVVLPAGDVIAPPIDCTPDVVHPRPVIVLPGADGTVDETAQQWQTVTATLRESGFCTLVFQGGIVDGTRWAGDMAAGAEQLAEFVAAVRETTGAESVDLVAHSAGSVVANYYLKVLGGADAVTHAVFLAPETRGCDGAGFLAAYGIHDSPVTPVQVLQTFPFLIPVLGSLSTEFASALQLVPGSDLYTRVFDAGSLTQPGVEYSVLATAHDELATPAPACSFIAEPGVTNVLFEDAFPDAPAVDHSSLRSSPYTAAWIVERLGR